MDFPSLENFFTHKEDILRDYPMFKDREKRSKLEDWIVEKKELLTKNNFAFVNSYSGELLAKNYDSLVFYALVIRSEGRPKDVSDFIETISKVDGESLTADELIKLSYLAYLVTSGQAHWNKKQTFEDEVIVSLNKFILVFKRWIGDKKDTATWNSMSDNGNFLREHLKGRRFE